ncbi:MAG: N-6 DNA methylase [Chloroflexia bacterium]|nr:N-6 DNA methylase [Chloroflexia bacterium]
MKEDINILKPFSFDKFIKKPNDENLSKEQTFFLKNEVESRIQIDGVYFSGNLASVYFKSITNFSPESFREICRIHKTIWNQRKVPFLYVTSPTELRVYNCFKEPVNPDTELDKLNELEIEKYSVTDTEEDLQRLVTVIGKAAIDSGEVWKNAEFANQFNISSRVDKKLIQNLKATKTELEKRNIPINIIHDLLTRSLFILYLEDIKATDERYYQGFKTNSSSYFHILEDTNATYKLFKAFEEKFNGDLFSVSDIESKRVNKEELRIIASCFWGNEVETGQQTLWKIFDFSVIPIELLSEIYEIFLNKTDEEKSNSGEYYTPHSLVDLILNESLPWANHENTTYNLTILDLACGSGIFLVESYRRLVDRWVFVNKRNPQFKELEEILVSSIFGFEVNSSSIKVAAFSLYLALISYLDPKTIWQQKSTRFPNLIFDPKGKDKNRQGKNLFLQSSLSNSVPHQPKI